MESQPQNPEFRNNPENFHPCIYVVILKPYAFWKTLKSYFNKQCDPDEMQHNAAFHQGLHCL